VRVALSISLLALAGCGAPSVAGPSEDPKEMHILAETARFASALKVRVRADITDEIYWVQEPNGNTVEAAGWYNAGVAHYWRPWLRAQSLEYGTALAAHEVCHAAFYFHTPQHTACVEGLLR
jgi:hypothetical protein